MYLKKKKIDEQRLMELVDKAARASGKTYSMESPKTEPKDFFEFHKIAISFTDTRMEDILAFDEQIETAQQNIRVEEVDMSSSGNGIVSAKFVIGALDIGKTKDMKALTAWSAKNITTPILSQMNSNIINENE
jgi:hypothetical protein